MLKELERLFGFRTSETTDVAHYLDRMDGMSKFDDRKQNLLTGIMIKRMITLEERIKSLEGLSQAGLAERVEALETKPDPVSHKQELSTMKADITRLKKKVYPAK